jgi:PIN domain nuclease of toxin-antitoxin system
LLNVAPRQGVSSCVLDASALLALLHGEPGASDVASLIASGPGAISTVNLSEVVGKLDEAGIPADDIRDIVASLRLEVVVFDVAGAFRAGLFRSLTRRAGLSLGDRACLALAQFRGLPAVTTDRIWGTLQLGIDIRVIR